jgi:hypothetical protein
MSIDATRPVEHRPSVESVASRQRYVVSVTLRVAINEPRLLGDLASALAAGACTMRPVSDRALEVSSVANGDAQEFATGLLFFLRAWADANGGVDVFLL